VRISALQYFIDTIAATEEEKAKKQNAEKFHNGLQR
jgi:hypothetical protein